MIDMSFVLGYMEMPFEGLRIAVSLAILAACTYFDLFRDKNIPDKVLYASIAIAAIIALPAPQGLILMGFGQAALLALACYLSYRMGYLGGAEMFIIPAIALLLPVPPAISGVLLNFPFILFTLLFSGMLFALTNFMYFAYRLAKSEAKLKLNAEGTSMALLTLVFAAIYVNSPMGNPAILAVVTSLGLMSFLYYTYKPELEEIMSGEVEVEKAEEEVVNPKKLDERAKPIFKSSPLVTAGAIKELKKLGIRKIIVMKGMPPYMPFLLGGEIVAILYARLLLF
jgi:hypothetical protein